MLSFLNERVFGPALPLFLMGAGLYLALRLGLFPVLHPVAALKGMLPEKGSGSLRAMGTALAGTLGVGNITGVAAAITAGGAGAVFWMWVSALFACFVKYAEVVLALRYRTKQGAGAPYYLRDGLGAGKLACFFSGVLLLANFTVGSPVQVYAAAEAMKGSFGVPPVLTGAVMALLVFCALCGGEKRITALTSVLIPVLAGGYFLLSALILIRYRERLPGVLHGIVTDALTPAAGRSGIGGFLLSRSLRFGTARGVLSNEAGCGTAPFAHAAANTKSPAKQGLFGIAEVVTDTLILCTVTALVLLLFPELIGTADPASLASLAYAKGAGRAAGMLLSLSCAVFAYASVIAWGYYGTAALTFLGYKNSAVTVYRTASALFCVIGAVIAPAAVWELADASVSVLTFLNVGGVLLLTPEVRQETVRYFREDERSGSRPRLQTPLHPPR